VNRTVLNCAECIRRRPFEVSTRDILSCHTEPKLKLWG